MVIQPQFPPGPFTHRDLQALGITELQLRQALDDGRVRAVVRGVFVTGEVADGFDLRIAAVARIVSGDHIACDRTAAWIHGVHVLGYAELEVLPRVETCVLPDRWATRAASAIGRSRDLSPEDVEEQGGLRLTTPLRTALDLACNLEQRDALAALDQFDRLFGIGAEQLLRELPRFRGRRGVVQARKLAPLVDARSESARESWVRSAIADAGLPVPEPQVWVERDGVPAYRLDLAYRAHRIAVEYDGDEFHRTDEQRRHDRQRWEWLRRQGWHVVVVGNGDFTGRRLDRWIQEIRWALASRYTNLRW